MGKVAIVTDSSACVPQQVTKECGIHVLPLILIFQDRSYRDGVDITSREFYELLKKAKKLPKSSSPSPGEYLEAFRGLGKQSDSILCITLPPHLGMAFDSATKAREMDKESLPHVSIDVFPSKGPTLAQGFIAQAAGRAAASDKDLSQVTRAALAMMNVV